MFINLYDVVFMIKKNKKKSLNNTKIIVNYSAKYEIDGSNFTI